MTTKFVVGYDGSEASDTAVRFALAQAKQCSATLVVVHVLEWSPYSFLTPTELEERHKRRNEELKRAEEALIAPLVSKLTADYGAMASVIRYGNIVDTLLNKSPMANVHMWVFNKRWFPAKKRQYIFFRFYSSKKWLMITQAKISLKPYNRNGRFRVIWHHRTYNL